MARVPQVIPTILSGPLLCYRWFSFFYCCVPLQKIEDVDHYVLLVRIWKNVYDLVMIIMMMIDLYAIGFLFTWSGGWRSSAYIQQCLDRAMDNSWMVKFVAALVLPRILFQITMLYFHVITLRICWKGSVPFPAQCACIILPLLIWDPIICTLESDLPDQ